MCVRPVFPIAAYYAEHHHGVHKFHGESRECNIGQNALFLTH
jgi:hypothetical protein